MDRKKAVIIGAGPSGLTAAYELATRSNIESIIIEKSSHLGGLAKTIDYKGYKIDIGGHRFFTKSQRVLDWWIDKLPLNTKNSKEFQIRYQGKSNLVNTKKSKSKEQMLVRNRKSSIYYKNHFYDYPLKLNFKTLSQIGIWESFLILSSYSKSLLFKREEKSLEDFFINRFGSRLYETFFKTYTEKVWGEKCSQMSPQWGAQRVKGLSLGKAISASLFGKSSETSLIEKFLYPKHGPGQMWEKVWEKCQKKGAKIYFDSKVSKIEIEDNKVKSVLIKTRSGKRVKISPDYFFSTIAIPDLVSCLRPLLPKSIFDIAKGLEYRDFLVVGLLLKKLKKPIWDNWIYIHDKGVKVGRIQIFNNWSPYLIKDKNKTWIGMEYFCNKDDDIWRMKDEKIINLALKELSKIGLASESEYLDGVVIKESKAYPSYTGTYKDFSKLKNYLDKLENLYLVGRNGMHKYNNQDHSMLTAMVAVDNILSGRKDKSNIWDVNTEEEYHESK